MRSNSAGAFTQRNPRRLPSASPYLSASGNRFQTSDSFLAPWVSDAKQKTDKHLLIASSVAIDADDYMTAAKFIKILRHLISNPKFASHFLPSTYHVRSVDRRENATRILLKRHAERA